MILQVNKCLWEEVWEREKEHKVEWVGKRIWEELELGRNSQICEKYIKMILKVSFSCC